MTYSARRRAGRVGKHLMLGTLIMAVATGVTTALPAGAVDEQRTPTLTESLRSDLEQYLSAHGQKDHFSALSLRVTYKNRRPDLAVSTGMRSYGGGDPVSDSALWQIGSNTKAFTSVAVLQLEAEGKLSIHDKLGKWLPRYPAWRDITIARLLSMTSGIPSYTEQPSFGEDIQADLSRHFTPERLVSYVADLPLGPAKYAYSNTNYILAQMIIERASHGGYSDQITERIIKPLGLHGTCLPPICRPGTAARMPVGYSTQLNKPVPPLALSWAQGAGGLVGSLKDVATWDRALYRGRELPAAQQRELESLHSVTTSKPITTVTADDPVGYGLGIAERTDPVIGRVWSYEGATLGSRVLHVYFPQSGTVIVIAVNSSVEEDTLPGLADTIYKTISASDSH